MIIGCAVGTQVDVLATVTIGDPIDVTFVAATVNLPVAQGVAPDVIVGSVQVAIAYGTATVMAGAPMIVTFEAGTVGVALP
jgi:hypothetical protein